MILIYKILTTIVILIPLENYILKQTSFVILVVSASYCIYILFLTIKKNLLLKFK